MVVLAPGTEIRAADIPPDVLEGPGTLLPVRLPQALQGHGGGFGGQELEFILRNLVELKIQVEELRRRLDDQPQRVQVIDLGEPAMVHEVLPQGDTDGGPPVVYQPGMTMAEVERATIEAALREYRGNRRKAAEVLGIGERTLYRKIKAYRLE
jgi:DNA-binding NtrC family response regulator